MKNHNCNNCKNQFEGDYCNTCGQSLRLNQRLELFRLGQDFFDNTFNLHKGFFFTFWNLIINPAKVLKGYIAGERQTYMNPTRYLVIALAAFAIVGNISGMQDIIDGGEFSGFSFLSGGLNNSMKYWDLKLISEWTLLGNLIEALVFPIGFYILFKKLNYNYAELLSVSFYLVSNSILITIIAVGLPKLFFEVYPPVSIIFSIILLYYYYALALFYREASVFKRLIYIFLGLVVFFIVRFIIVPFLLAVLFPVELLYVN